MPNRPEVREGQIMPIRFEETGSITEIERDILVLESEYKMTSEGFLALDCMDDRVSEFDAIEWNFLLMQKKALVCADGPEFHVFPAQWETETGTVDSNDVRQLIAA